MPKYRTMGLPKLTGHAERDIKNLRDLFYQQDEQLRYLFDHMGSDDIDNVYSSLKTEIDQNTDAIELRATKEYVAESLNGYVAETELEAELKVSAEGVLTTVSKSYATTDVVNTAQNTANAAGAAAAGAQNTANSAKGTADAVAANLSNNYYSKTTVDQKFNSITLSVLDSSGQETSIKLSSGKLDLSGLVTFQDLSTQGKTTINGSNITTGTINADLIKAGTIRGISYYSQSTENINDYLTIGGGSFESRRYVRTVNGYHEYSFVTVRPGELRCAYGELDQVNNNAYYSYDGLWIYAGDDAESPESLVSCFALESDKSLLIYGKNGIGFEGSANFKGRLNVNGGIYYSNTSIMQMINSNADLAIGWGSLNASAGSTYVAAGKNVYLRSGTDAIYMFPCYKNSPAPCAVVVGDSGSGDPNVHPSATGGRGYLGTINYKWKSVYATTGTIQTSDRRLKRNISDNYSKYEKLILSLRPVTFDFIDLNDGIERTGLIAQEVLEVMEQCGIDAKKTLFVIDDKIDPESALGQMVGDDHVLGMNYEQFIVPTIAVVQKLEKRIEELEKRIA